MKKLLLTLLVLLSFGFAASAETFDFQPSTTSGLPTSATTDATEKTFNNFTLTFYQTWWQKSKELGYIAFKKNVTDAYVQFSGIEGKKVTKIRLEVSNNGYASSVFKIFVGDTNAGTITFANKKGELEIPENIQVAGAPIKIQTGKSGNQCTFSIAEFTFADVEEEKPTEKIELAVENLIVKAGEEALVADETYDLEKNTTVTFAYETEENADITYSYIVNDEAEVEGNSYTFTGEDDVFLTVKATSTNTVEKSFILNKWYPASCPAPKISLAVADTEVYAGKVVTIDGNGADKTEWNVNGTPIDGTSYTITEAVGTELIFTVTNTTTIRVNGEFKEKQSEITRTVTVVEKSEVTFDFAINSYGLTLYNSTNSKSGNKQLYEKDVENPVTKLTEGIVSIDLTGNYRLWEVKTGNQLRAMSGATLTISVPSIYYITAVTFTGSSYALSTESDIEGEQLSSVTYNRGSDNKAELKSITVKYALRPTEIVNFTHDGIVSKAHVASLKYTLHVANHKDDSMYAVTLTLKDKDGVEVSATNEEHSLVEAPVAMAPARAATATHYLSGSVGFDDLTPEMTYTPTVSYGLKGAEPTGSVELPAITMLTTGIEDVTVDGNEAAEYFNLQGVRVAQPEAGQIYIVRRGAKVVKELVK